MRRSRQAGFTLIELLIVVVIIGILASIAIPKFSNTKGKAYAASMRSDLRNLATAEEGYYYSYDMYTDDITKLDFTPSSGVVITFGVATASGWALDAHGQQARVLGREWLVGQVIASERFAPRLCHVRGRSREFCASGFGGDDRVRVMGERYCIA